MVQLQLVPSEEAATNNFYNPDYLSSSHSMDSVKKHPTVCKHALLRKVKTNKNKYFVLHKDSATAPARLEYYDSLSQWNKKKKAKRTIYLKTCFSINIFADTRVQFGLSIFTKDDSFQIGFDSEQTRDMWLADMRVLSHSSPDHTHSAVEHMWCVRAYTRGIKCPFEGEFKLYLNEQQASLLSKKDPEQVLVVPLDVITNCAQKSKFFGIEVNHNAEAGAGEIWMELEDSLIAQHVHRAFTQNLSIASQGNDDFRPVSRSLSFKDKKAAYTARLRSGSDARQRGIIGQSLFKLGHQSTLELPSHNFASVQRDRSDSIDSHSTTASLSTDDSSDCSYIINNWQTTSRSITPDHRLESQHVSGASRRSAGDNCKCLSSNSSLSSDAAQSDSYADMMHGALSRPQDKNSNFMYVDMSGTHALPYLDMQSNSSDGYLDMSAGQSSPNTKGCKLKPEPAKCYLIENDCCSTSQPKSETSTDSRPQANPTSQTDAYVEMCRSKMLTGKDKSSSAPHLLPMPPHQHRLSEQKTEADVFMNMDFDNRDRTASLSCTHRPRGSSWSQFVRPRSSTTEQKRRTSRTQRLYNNNNMSDCIQPHDYIDMTCGSSTGSKDSYVEMSLSKNSRERLAAVKHNSAEREDKENHLPHHTSRSGRVPPITHPFPELLSASSEDDVSLHSMEGSVSLHSLTSSADSMSTSSHSSHHSNAFTSSLDMEPYVAVHSAPSPNYIKSTTHRTLMKPARLTSYILDDTEEKPKAADTKRSEYVEMAASANKHTKR